MVPDSFNLFLCLHQAGTFIPPHELEAARLLLDGSAWAATAPRPFWLPKAGASDDITDGAAAVAVAQVEASLLPDQEVQPNLEEESLPEVNNNGEASAAPKVEPPTLAAPSEASAAGGPAAESEEGVIPEAEGPDAPVSPEVGTQKAFSSGWRPLPPPQDLPIPPTSTSDGPALGPEQQAGRVALSVLRGALAEALDPSRLSPVVHAWGCLRPGRVPAFAELRGHIPEEYRQQPLEEISADAVDVPESLEGHVGDDSRVLQSRDFQELAEFVLENAVMGLVNESVAGEWKTTSP